MKQKVSPAIVIAVVVVLLGGVGFVVWKALTGTDGATPVVVKPQNPDDPKFKRNPNLATGGI